MKIRNLIMDDYGFFMLPSQALDAILKFSPKEFSALSGLLSPEHIDECLADTGVVTVRKRRLLLEMMVWAVTGLALFRSLSMNKLVSYLARVNVPSSHPVRLCRLVSGPGLRPSA